MNPMFDKLKKIEDRYEFLTAEISRPDIIADNSVWKKLVKEHSGLQDVVNVYREWKRRGRQSYHVDCRPRNGKGQRNVAASA